MTLAIAPAGQLILLSTLTSAERRARQRGCERGEFVRLRRGVVVPASLWAGLDERRRAVLSLHALALVSAAPPVLSHWSAALLHGLPVTPRAAATAHRTSGGEHAPSQPGVVTHLLRMDDTDLTRVDGLLVTTPARTAVDLAAAASFELGVVAIDATLRLLGRGTGPGRALLLEAWARAGARRGDSKVAAAVAFGDALSESPAETRSRVTMRRLHIPPPVLQRVFADGDGFVARGDFWFPELHVVGEVDGKQKYFDQDMTEGDPATVHYREKIRDERLRAIGEHPLHWGWREAVDPVRLARRLASAGVLPTVR